MRLFRLIALIAILAIIAYFLIGFIFTAIAYYLAFKRAEKTDESKNETNKNYRNRIKEVPYERTSFKSGKNTLQAYIFGSSNDRGLLVFAHGLWSSHKDYINQIIYLVEEGWQVFTYDATGCGESEGSSSLGLVQSALDLNKALNYIELQDDFKDKDIYLFGHSWGGYAVTAVQNFNHDIKATVSVSGYAYPVDMLMEVLRKLLKDVAGLLYPFAWIINLLRFGRWHRLNGIKTLKKIKNPMLVVHGQDDALISSDGASLFSYRHKVENSNVTFIRWTIEGFTGHDVLGNFNCEIDVEKIVDDIADDLDKYILENKLVDKEKLIEDINIAIEEQNADTDYRLNIRLMRVVNYFFMRELRED